MGLAWSAALALGWCALVRADGMFMGAAALDERASGKTAVASTEQKGVVIELPQGREALLLQTTYHGPADRFAWVIPVPGKPGKDDVFLAEPAFIDELLKRTAPEVRTKIIAPASVGWAKRAAEAPGAEGVTMQGEQPGVPAVTVHERMQVGEFDATVLSATGANVLTDWLQANGYRVPDDSADILGHYVRQQWYFLALKMQPKAVEARPVLGDVDPIGIRFAAAKLVYPLYISRASSRQKTGMLLAILSRQPVACDQLPEARLPLKKRFRKGGAYATIRRELLDSGPPALVAEFRGPGVMPHPDLYYEKNAWAPREGRDWSVKSLWATRYFTLLDREEMDDLTFSPSPDSTTMRLVIERVGKVYVPLPRRTPAVRGSPISWAIAGLLLYLLFAWLAQRGFHWRPGRATAGVAAAVALGVAFMLSGPVGAVLLVLALPAYLVALALSHPSSEPLPDDRISLGERVRISLLAAGVGGLGYIALQVLTPGARLLDSKFGDGLEELCQGEAGLMRFLVAIGVLGAWVGLAIDQVARGCRGAGWRWVWLALPLTILTAIVGIALERHVGPHTWLPVPTPQSGASAAAQFMGWSTTFASLLALVALLLVISYLMVAPWIAPRQGRRIQPLALAVILLPVLGVLSFLSRAVSAEAGSGGYLATGTRELDRSLQILDGLMTEFYDRHGCYPEKLGDLVASAIPEMGVDSSGNAVVTVQAGAPAAPGGAQLPLDPLTGRRDTWVYEPTGTPMVDSGGYEVTLSRVAATEPPQGEAGHDRRHPHRGRSRSSGGPLVCRQPHRERPGRVYEVYAVRGDKRNLSVELFAQAPKGEAPGAERIEVLIDQRPRRARICARLWSDAFRPGDLVAESFLDRRQVSVGYVDSCKGGWARVASRTCQLFPTDSIRLGPGSAGNRLVKVKLE